MNNQILIQIHNFIGKNNEYGDVRLDQGKYPEVFINGMWSPICGHWFWDNNNGATLFCKKLDPQFRSGVVSRKRVTLTKNAVRVGRCEKWRNDQWLKCTGPCNGNGIGGSCPWGGRCSRGNRAGIEIRCNR